MFTPIFLGKIFPIFDLRIFFQNGVGETTTNPDKPSNLVVTFWWPWALGWGQVPTSPNPPGDRTHPTEVRKLQSGLAHDSHRKLGAGCPRFGKGSGGRLKVSFFRGGKSGETIPTVKFKMRAKNPSFSEIDRIKFAPDFWPLTSSHPNKAEKTNGSRKSCRFLVHKKHSS